MALLVEPDAQSVQAWIGIGGNLGDAQAMVEWAISQIAALDGVRHLKASSLYRTAPVDAGGPDYVNAVAGVHTHLSALDLLHALQSLEHRAGRERPYRNAPRTLDLDLLLHGDDVRNTPELTLPHPRLWERAFVLVPLAEVAPQLVRPEHLLAVADQRIERIAGSGR